MITIMLTKQNYDEVMEALGEIIIQIGPYKVDNHEHALSVMDNSTENAKRVRYLLRNMIVEKTGDSLATTIIQEEKL